MQPWWVLCRCSWFDDLVIKQVKLLVLLDSNKVLVNMFFFSFFLNYERNKNNQVFIGWIPYLVKSINVFFPQNVLKTNIFQSKKIMKSLIKADTSLEKPNLITCKLSACKKSSVLISRATYSHSGGCLYAVYVILSPPDPCGNECLHVKQVSGWMMHFRHCWVASEH